MTLENFFEKHRRVALGFSGGVDSSYLLCFASRCGVDIAPYFARSAFQPAFELEDARRVAEFAGVPLRIIDVDVLSDPTITANGADRCYLCKRAIFGKIKSIAADDGYDTVIDGTNASDDPGDRPGTMATGELGVLSPLAVCGLAKDDVRAASREMGLFTHDKPSYSCLATRIRTGELITRDKLARVEEAEKFLFSLCLKDLRVRLSGGEAIVQLPDEETEKFLAHRGVIAEKFESLGIASAALDLRPRRTEK